METNTKILLANTHQVAEACQRVIHLATAHCYVI